LLECPLFPFHTHGQAYEHLSNEVKRRQYDVKLQDEEENGPRRRGAGGRPNWATYEGQ
jgi:DnaJ-class molecular chaperone